MGEHTVAKMVSAMTLLMMVLFPLLFVFVFFVCVCAVFAWSALHSPSDSIETAHLQAPMITHITHRYRGVQAINWKDGQTIVGSLHVTPDSFGDELVVVTGSGYGKRVNYVDVPLADKHNIRPPLVIARKPVVGVSVATDQAQLLTSEGVVEVDWERLAEPDGTTKSQILVKVKGEERTLGIIY